jgi:hypothetical protein
MISVRFAIPQDVDFMVNAMREHANEQPYFKKLFDEEEAPKGFRDVIMNHLALVAQDEKKNNLGFIVGTITPHLYNPKLTLLAHLLWWVEKSRRGGVAAHYLFTSFVDYGLKHADMITLSIRDDVPLKPSSFAKYGLERHDKCYIMFK